MKKRPQGFVTVDGVADVVEKSIDSVVAWGEKTNDAWGDTDEKIEHLNELMDIVVELKWRYGGRHVAFKFTRKKVPNTIPLGEVINSFWANRIHIDERPEMARVYINF